MLIGRVGTAITLETSGGSGDGAVTFAVMDAGTAGCTVTETSLVATSGGFCYVRATKAASTGYFATISTTETFLFTGPRPS
jgi:hypothetical protein